MGADLTGATLAGYPDRETLEDLGIEHLTRVRGGLYGATLLGATLHDTDLTDTDLRGATLAAADLTGANLSGTVLAGASLYGVRGCDNATVPPILLGCWE